MTNSNNIDMDVSVLVRLYENQSLRFGIFPETIKDFYKDSNLENVHFEVIPSRMSEQGTLVCQRNELRFIYDAVTGNFKFVIKKEEILKGLLQTGQFGEALFYLELKENDSINGFGSTLEQPIYKNTELYLHWDGTFSNPSQEKSQKKYPKSTFSFFLISREDTCIGIYYNSPLALKASIIKQQTETKNRGVYITPLAQSEPIHQDFFIFMGTLPEIYSQFFSLTGQPFMPPIWAFGIHTSNSIINDAEKFMKYSAKYKKENIPLDAIYINESYMDANKVFQWSKDKYPHTKNFLKYLSEENVHAICDVQPKILVNHHFEIYQKTLEQNYFCKYQQDTPYYLHDDKKKYVIPDFTNETVQLWWAELYSKLFENGISGIVNKNLSTNNHSKKENDPYYEVNHILRRSSGGSEIYDLFSMTFAKASFLSFSKNHNKQKPIVLTHKGGVGIQKYAILVLSGKDGLTLSFSSWKNLKTSFYKALNLSMSGISFFGLDIGVFKKYNLLTLRCIFTKKSEMFLRAIEFASLLPLFRICNHSKFQALEAWSFGSKTLSLVRKHFQRRFSLLPYFYTLAYQCQKFGNLWMRPLHYDYPNINKDLVEDQFMIGPNLLAAPLLHPNLKSRKVFLPEGNWYEFESSTIYQGATIHHFTVNIGYYPLFIKAGSILPFCYPKKNAKDSYSEILILEIFPEKEMQGFVYIDDGISKNSNSQYVTINGKMNTSNVLSIEIEGIDTENFTLFKKIEFRLPLKYIFLQVEAERLEAKNLDLALTENRQYSVSTFTVPFEAGKFLFRTN